jgi:hypothetical protein
MLQTVELVLGIDQSSTLAPSDILDRIQEHIRSQRSVALDRMEFEECRQEVNESFDDFYIKLRRIAECADLCKTCWDSRLSTRIISGIRDQEARKKLLAKSPFPSVQEAIYLCRSKESASKNEPMLGRAGHTEINRFSEGEWKLLPMQPDTQT